MLRASIMDDLRSFRRSWVHHTGMQLATLTVLAATFTVVAFVLSFAVNMKRMLANWGSSVQMNVYLVEDITDVQTRVLKRQLETMSGVRSVSYVASEKATENFKTQMASYAPDLLADADFSNPFPASFRITLKGGVQTDQDVVRLEALAERIGQLAGVEDVSYGQSWIKNFSSFVSTLSASGGVIVLILLAGSLFVVGNSIRTSIAARREEIEILELVGATSRMIRRPYIMEGLVMGFLAAGIALTVNFGLFTWESLVLSRNVELTRLVGEIAYFDWTLLIAVLFAGAALGAFGAWLTVRQLNDGWSASQRLEL